MVLLYSNLRASKSSPKLKRNYYPDPLKGKPMTKKTGDSVHREGKGEGKGGQEQHSLTSAEISLLISYRTLQGNIEQRRQGALAKALGSPNAPGSLRSTQRSLDPYLQGRRDAIRELHLSGGLPDSQVGLEVLYLLPDSFVQFYQRLFHQALQGGQSQAVSGRGNGIAKAPGHTGMALGSDTRPLSTGSGKKYKRPTSSLGNSQAMEVKAQVDRELEQLVNTASDALRTKSPRSTRSSSPEPSTPSRSPLQCRGRITVTNGPDTITKGCGKFLKQGWRFCPTCGTTIGL